MRSTPGSKGLPGTNTSLIRKLQTKNSFIPLVPRRCTLRLHNARKHGDEMKNEREEKSDTKIDCCQLRFFNKETRLYNFFVPKALA